MNNNYNKVILILSITWASLFSIIQHVSLVGAGNLPYIVSISKPVTEEGEDFANLMQTCLANENIGHHMTDSLEEASHNKLIIIPDWSEDQGCYRTLRDYYYAGGRIIFFNLPKTKYAQGISDFVFRTLVKGGIEFSQEGRACHIRNLDSLTKNHASVAEILSRVLEARDHLPNALPVKGLQSAEDTALKNGVLLIQGKPVLFRAMGAYNINHQKYWAMDLRDYSMIGLNGLVAYVSSETNPDSFSKFLDMAWEHRFRLLVWLYPAHRYVRESGGLPWRNDWLLNFLQYRKHPALLGWLISDDTFDTYFPVLEQIANVIRRYDKDNFITATCMDLRWPEKLPLESWEKWKTLLDYPITYLYPLQRDGILAKANIEGGLEDVQRLAQNTLRVWGGETYFQQWCQSHMQAFAYEKLDLGRSETYLATPEQLRLLTYMMIADGTRGILYYSANAFENNAKGIGRRSELGILWQELQPISETLATGTWHAATKVTKNDVEVSFCSVENEKVALLIKHGEHYHRYVSDGVVEGLIIEVKLDNMLEPSAYLIGFPSVNEVPVERLSNQRIRLQIPSFDLTSLLLISENRERIAAVKKTIETMLPSAAKRAYTVASDKLRKTESVCHRLGANVSLAVLNRLNRSKEQLSAAKELLAHGKYVQSYRLSREVQRICQTIQKTLIEEAQRIYDSGKAPNSSRIYLNIFYSLPNFYQSLKPSSPSKLRISILNEQ